MFDGLRVSGKRMKGGEGLRIGFGRGAYMSIVLSVSILQPRVSLGEFRV